MNYYIITDTHFNHEKLIEYWRPANYEQKIKKNLLINVKPTDVLIHIWDVCIGKDIESNNWFKDNLKCRTILVKWNHDTKSNKWYMENWWDIACERFDIEMFWKRICFTHIPIAWDWYFDVNIHWHFHDTDHRRFEPEFNKILSWYNKLLSMENVDYQPQLLNNLL